MLKEIEERRDRYTKNADTGQSAVYIDTYLTDIDWLLEDRARLCRKLNDLQSENIRLRKEGK